MTQHPNHIEELREERIEWLREQIRRCSEVIERGAPDSWWYEDRSRYQHELRQLEEGPKLTNHIPTDSAYPHQASGFVGSEERIARAAAAIGAVQVNMNLDILGALVDASPNADHPEILRDAALAALRFAQQSAKTSEGE